MFPKKWKDFRSAVFKRDGRKCQFLKENGKKCGSTRRIVPHHILKKSTNPALCFDPDNGITLCNSCHVYKVTGNESFYAPIFMRTVRDNKGRANGKN